MTEFLKRLLIFLCDVPIKLVIIFFPKSSGSFRCWVMWCNNVPSFLGLYSHISIWSLSGQGLVILTSHSALRPLLFINVLNLSIS